MASARVKPSSACLPAVYALMTLPPQRRGARHLDSAPALDHGGESARVQNTTHRLTSIMRRQCVVAIEKHRFAAAGVVTARTADRASRSLETMLRPAPVTSASKARASRGSERQSHRDGGVRRLINDTRAARANLATAAPIPRRRLSRTWRPSVYGTGAGIGWSRSSIQLRGFARGIRGFDLRCPDRYWSGHAHRRSPFAPRLQRPQRIQVRSRERRTSARPAAMLFTWSLVDVADGGWSRARGGCARRMEPGTWRASGAVVTARRTHR